MSSRNFNPNHDADGKFSAGAGGKHIGKSASDRQQMLDALSKPIPEAQQQGTRYAAAVKVAEKIWPAEKAAEHKRFARAILRVQEARGARRAAALDRLRKDWRLGAVEPRDEWEADAQAHVMSLLQ